MAIDPLANRHFRRRPAAGTIGVGRDNGSSPARRRLMTSKSDLVSKSLAGALGLVAVLASGAAAAGECPAGKATTDSKQQAVTEPKGVTDNVLRMIDLAKEPGGAKGRSFRLRRLEIEPGGVVPWHSHGERPAIIYVVSGEVSEYASTCAVPIVHKAGEATAETHATSHWWKNTGKTKAVLLSADLLKVGDDPDMM
jgi:quercetin dioxygenase-like cupin family protein